MNTPPPNHFMWVIVRVLALAMFMFALGFALGFTIGAALVR